ncbi:hypothetical protein F4604DRAFT_1714167 [Suillus subluteus]|nr:hypothetical protein F4604DRAFT_1714167 [Suillus subluteus]
MHSTQSHGNRAVLQHGIELDEPNAFPQLLRLCPSLFSLTIFTSFIATEALAPFTHTRLIPTMFMTVTQSIFTYSILPHFPICAFSKLAVYTHGLMRNSRRF